MFYVVEVQVFCYASTKGDGGVAYLSLTGSDRVIKVGFVFGKARLLASDPDMTISHCNSAVLAIEMADLIQEEVDVVIDEVILYTDS